MEDGVLLIRQKNKILRIIHYMRCSVSRLKYSFIKKLAFEKYCKAHIISSLMKIKLFISKI